jgi:predicted RNase H-like HicB family nuclease
MRCAVNYQIEFEQEEDGRWIADIPGLPGVMAYGPSKRKAESKVRAIVSQMARRLG